MMPLRQHQRSACLEVCLILFARSTVALRRNLCTSVHGLTPVNQFVNNVCTAPVLGICPVVKMHVCESFHEQPCRTHHDSLFWSNNMHVPHIFTTKIDIDCKPYATGNRGNASHPVTNRKTALREQSRAGRQAPARAASHRCSQTLCACSCHSPNCGLHEKAVAGVGDARTKNRSNS